MAEHPRQTRTALALASIIAATAGIIATAAAAHPSRPQARPYDPSAYVYGGASLPVATAIQTLGYKQARS
jgi:hypothetical protein